ncbi:MAG TPA: cytochrome P450 [Acidimicrobiales bacterium]|nr:cytochrome P450 [Acidimicrobiales bacterium]
MSAIADLPELDTFSSEFQADPHGLNRAALARGPIARSPFGVEVLSYEGVQAVIKDRRYGMPAGLTLAAQGITEGPLWDRVVNGILSIDGDEHARLRRFVAQSFTPRTTDRLRESMRTFMGELLDAAPDDGELDAVELVKSYPISVICELLGTPRGDWPLFSDWTDDIFKIFQFNAVQDGPDILRAFGEVDAYIDAMVEERRRDPRDDLMTELVHAEDEGERLTREELRMLAGAVLSAGTDTTRNQLAAAIQEFATHPDQWAAMPSDVADAPRVVDEVMRYSPVIMGTARQPVEDVELLGVEIPSGTMVAVNTAAANRDPAVYDEPDRFDIRRSGAAPHLTFGGGIHYCLGVHLAKAELAEALVQVRAKWPTIEQNGPAPWKPVVGISGPSTLPLHVSR